MKIFLSILSLFFAINFSAQNQKLKGQFTGENLNKSFINVINLNQNKATISQKDGRFEIPAKIGDSILISSIQYDEIKFLVRPEFLQSQIEIPLALKINELEQVNLYSLGLTGHIKTDLKHIKTNKSLKIDIESFDISNAYDEKVTTQSEFTLRNVALEQNQIPSSFDFIGIFKLAKNLFRKKEGDKELSENKLYQSNKLEDLDFFVAFLEINNDNVGQFIEYAKSNGLKKEMLKKENELDLIEFLMDISKAFKAEYGE